MKMYYSEDRSTGKTGKNAHPKVSTLLQLVELTDWKPEDIDAVTDLDISEEITIDRWLYVKRLT